MQLKFSNYRKKMRVIIVVYIVFYLYVDEREIYFSIDVTGN